MKRYSIRADSGASTTGANIFESSTGYWVSYTDHESALKAAVAAERQACWQIADDAGLWIQLWEKKYGNVSIADAIKARGAAHD